MLLSVHHVYNYTFQIWLRSKLQGRNLRQAKFDEAICKRKLRTFASRGSTAQSCVYSRGDKLRRVPLSTFLDLQAVIESVSVRHSSSVRPIRDQSTPSFHFHSTTTPIHPVDRIRKSRSISIASTQASSEQASAAPPASSRPGQHSILHSAVHLYCNSAPIHTPLHSIHQHVRCRRFGLFWRSWMLWNAPEDIYIGPVGQ